MANNGALKQQRSDANYLRWPQHRAHGISIVTKSIAPLINWHNNNAPVA